MQILLQHHFHHLGKHFYSEAQPQGLDNPTLVCSSAGTARLLGLDPTATGTDAFLKTFSGNTLPPGSRPLAHDYAGHQMGQFNPSLGDGRVILLGELPTGDGHWEIALKGAGKTPYSRKADGFASLGECLHEFEVSETLAQLGIPTTRSLCVIQGSQQVYRQGFQPRAILTRIAPSHIRFGSFENCYAQQRHQELRMLADFVVAHHYPQHQRQAGNDYSGFFREVVLRTARLIAHWQAAGFVHGMMNTDNQSILGITLDLGSAGFTPGRDPQCVTSPEDTHGRYAFGQQPVVGLWNCNVLAKALSPLIPATDLRTALLAYEPEYLRQYAGLTSAQGA